jgi:hypothetical protein
MNAKINREARRSAADLLQAVLEGNISAADAIEKWPSDYSDKLVNKVCNLLYHFRDDEDIRSKDKRYADWQFNEFRSLLAELRRMEE